jgi:hypothetical protein
MMDAPQAKRFLRVRWTRSIALPLRLLLILPALTADTDQPSLRNPEAPRHTHPGFLNVQAVFDSAIIALFDFGQNAVRLAFFRPTTVGDIAGRSVKAKPSAVARR